MNIADLLRPHLRSIKPYSSARDEYSGSEGVFLDANENPIGSAAGNQWNRYPDPYQSELKKEIGRIKFTNTENLFLGNGSDEPIDLLIRAFCEPEKDHILIFPPTYGMYKVSADIQNIEVKEVLLQGGFQLNIPELLKALQGDPKITFLCSPNNPSGNILNSDDISEVLDAAKGIVVIDEAYIDFANQSTHISLLKKYPNLVILQTFSKAWGMASLRLGMAFANEEVISILNKIKPPYNIPGPIQEMALNAIQNNLEIKNNWVEMIEKERERLIPILSRLDIVRKVHPSDTNFLLVQFKEAKEIFHYLLKQKVIVRDRSTQPLCEGCLRITVGTPEENDELLNLLKAY